MVLYKLYNLHNIVPNLNPKEYIGLSYALSHGRFATLKLYKSSFFLNITKTYFFLSVFV